MTKERIHRGTIKLALLDIAKGIPRALVSHRYKISQAWLTVLVKRHLEFRAYWKGTSEFHPRNEANRKAVEGNKNSQVGRYLE